MERDRRQLMRLLHGELPEAEGRRLRERLEREPDLERSWRALAGTWNGLDLPTPTGAGPGFATRTVARARSRQREDVSWRAAPVWVRAMGAAALSMGIALGALLASSPVAVSAPADRMLALELKEPERAEIADEALPADEALSAGEVVTGVEVGGDETEELAVSGLPAEQDYLVLEYWEALAGGLEIENGEVGA